MQVGVELALLPVQEGVGPIAAAIGTDSYELATARGEDYELLVALPPTVSTWRAMRWRGAGLR